MAEVVEVEHQRIEEQQKAAECEAKEDYKKKIAIPPPIPPFSFNIWPPTQRTRDAVLARLVDTLSSTSVLSQRYGSVPRDEASSIAHRIEEEAFSIASASSVNDVATPPVSDDDGIEILQIYSTEISKRMLEAVKARAASAASSPATDFAVEASPPSSAAAVEEISSVDTESSQA